MLPSYLSPVANHVWQSTLFAAAAVLLAFSLNRHRAHTRYWVWLAASLKFLIPFSLLIDAGTRFQWRSATAVPPISAAASQLSQPFTPPAPDLVVLAAPPASLPVMNTVLPAIWLCGFVTLMFVWVLRWRRVRAGVRAAVPLTLDTPIPARSSPALLEPGVCGVLRPVLLLPDGIASRLTAEQLQAILAHEMCHVRRRDNLFAAIHMFIQALFWFHPLVWWIGKRLIDERERACDEEVVRMGSEPRVYAQGILNVCKYYLESPLPCASGVTGSGLKKRIETIMSNRISLQLSRTKRLLLACAGLVALAFPVLIGIFSPPAGRAQSQQPEEDKYRFEVASIKPSDPNAQGGFIRFVPGGGINITNGNLRMLITIAYDIRDSQLSGGPAWLGAERFDIVAKPPESEPGPTDLNLTDEQRKVFQRQMRSRIRHLLAERFQLAVHKEPKEMQAYALVVGKSGHKLKASENQVSGQQHMRMGRGQINAVGFPIGEFAKSLSNMTGRPVVDRTELKGRFDFQLDWTPDPGGPMGPGGALRPPPGAPQPPPPDPSGPSLFTAVQEQLGLRLESTKSTVEVLVIDKIEKPSAN